MKYPDKKLSGFELDEFLIEAQEYSISSIKRHFSKYDCVSLYHNWMLLLRCIDELINLPLEIENEKTQGEFLTLSFDLINGEELKKFMIVLKKIELQFGNEVSERLLTFAKMNYVSALVYEKHGLNRLLPFNFSNVSSAISYYQSRRKYYVTILDLIKEWATGDYKFDFIDTLNEFQYTMDSCLQNITTDYYSILLNNCINNYSVDFRVKPPKMSHHYHNLESFLLEPQTLSMLDQLEYRLEQTKDIKLEKLPKDKVFSFIEIENNIKLIASTYSKYDIGNSDDFIEIKFLVKSIKAFCNDDFNIIISKDIFENEICKYIRKIKLISDKNDYFYASNFVSAFQFIDNNYFTSVVLLNRFITNRVQLYLIKLKSFQINSGFIFEEKVSKVLSDNGYQLSGITRINRKEFDVITVKNNFIYNFQCKNNLIDISRIQDDPKRMAKLNSRLVKYYDKAYNKEVNREKLITDKLGIVEIKHYVVSRYPVITETDYIINYNELNKKTKLLT